MFSWQYISSIARHAVLPALSIILTSLGAWALTMRGLMVNTVGEDYMLLAEAKGLPKRRILWRYAVRNAIPPQVTHLAIALGYVVSGAILVEIVFSYPGLATSSTWRSSTATTRSFRASPSSWPSWLCRADHRPDLPAAGSAGDVRGESRAMKTATLPGTTSYNAGSTSGARYAGDRFLQRNRISHVRLGFCFCLRSTCSHSSDRS